MLATAYSMWQLCQKPYSFRVLATTAGDNITPPQQAFNWIARTYGTVEEIKRRGQVIVCIGHSKIGHLGIFVSAKIARKEHKEIIASFDMLTYLPPGLYEMRIEEDPDQAGEYAVKYIEKNMDDILALDDGLEDEKAFLAVRQVSETADLFYRNMVSPWIRQANNDFFCRYPAPDRSGAVPHRSNRYGSGHRDPARTAGRNNRPPGGTGHARPGRRR